MAKYNEISHVLVEGVNRIDCHAVEIIYYLYDLCEECGVTIITNASGEVDVATFQGIAQSVLKALSSQLANETQARLAHNIRAENFKSKKWTSVSGISSN